MPGLQSTCERARVSEQERDVRHAPAHPCRQNGKRDAYDVHYPTLILFIPASDQCDQIKIEARGRDTDLRALPALNLARGTGLLRRELPPEQMLLSKDELDAKVLLQVLKQKRNLVEVNSAPARRHTVQEVSMIYDQCGIQFSRLRVRYDRNGGDG